MRNNQTEVEQETAVKDPRLSLTQFSRYYGSTANGRERILLGSKYPGNYIPKYYNIARNIITATFSTNFDDYDLYFEEFRRHASRLKKEALTFPPKTDNYKNRSCSAEALEGLIRMSDKLIPILERYVLGTNRKRASITIHEVKISSKADMLLFDLTGEQIGLLRLNFSKAHLKASEVEVALEVLKAYSLETDGLSFKFKDCIFIDIPSQKVFTASSRTNIDSILADTCAEIKKIWVDL